MFTETHFISLCVLAVSPTCFFDVKTFRRVFIVLNKEGRGIIEEFVVVFLWILSFNMCALDLYFYDTQNSS